MASSSILERAFQNSEPGNCVETMTMSWGRSDTIKLRYLAGACLMTLTRKVNDFVSYVFGSACLV